MMKVYKEISLWEYDFYGVAKDNFESLTAKDVNSLEIILEEMYPDGIGDEELNDLFAYDFDNLCDWVGITNGDY